MVATIKWESMVMIFAIIVNDRTSHAVRLTVQKHHLFFFRSALSLDDANQSLTLARVSNGHHETPAHLELRNQRVRNCWTTRSNEYRIVRRVCRPTECAVKTFNGGVVDSELSNSCLRFACKIADAFDRINLCSDL